jgi:tetratricopeptide (TPR) repeat protein
MEKYYNSNGWFVMVQVFQVLWDSATHSESFRQDRTENHFMKEESTLIGLKMIEIECSARGLGRKKINEIKQNYTEFVVACTNNLREKGFGAPVTAENILGIWSEISSFLWSNFTYSPTQFLSEAFDHDRTISFKFVFPCSAGEIKITKGDDLVPHWDVPSLSLTQGEVDSLLRNGHLRKRGAGIVYKLEASGEATVKGSFIDCDTSAYVVADIFKQLGAEPNILFLPNHAILNIGGKSGYYIETTRNTVEEDISMTYYVGQVKVKRKYGTAGTLIPFSESIAYQQAGRDYLYKGEYQKALELFDKLINQFPGFKDAYSDRGFLYFTINDYARAIPDFEKALQTASASSYADESHYGDLIECYLQLENYEQAIRACSSAIDLGFFRFLPHRADLYSQLGKHQEAIADYTAAIGKYPEKTTNYILRRAASRVFLKQYNEAIADYSAVIARHPKNGDAFFKRAEVYATQGKYVHAAVNYKMAYNAYRENREFEKAGVALNKANACSSKPNSK